MKKIIILGLSTLMSFGAMASEEDLEGIMDVFKVTTNSESKEVVTKALDAVNGDLLEYKITYKNNTDRVFSNVSVLGKIPTTTTFVENSEIAFKNSSAKGDSSLFNPVFSIDNGSTWSKTPMRKILKDGNIVEVEAPVSDYNMIKWNIESFAPNSDTVFKYRVFVNQ